MRNRAYRPGLFQSTVINYESKPHPGFLANHKHTQEQMQTQIELESLHPVVILMRSERYTASPLEGTPSENNINRHNKHPGVSRHSLSPIHTCAAQTRATFL